MLIAHYAHRLPATYDLGLIRTRVRTRGALWSAVPELHFKAFLVREAGRYGAAANEYSSLYLWRRGDAFRDFLTDGRFKVVTDAFGRPPIRTWVGLEARRGPGSEARFAALREADLPVDTDLTDALAAEAAWCRKVSAEPDVVVATAGLDSGNWRTLRIVVTESEPDGTRLGTWYEVGHLAQPLRASLAHGEDAG
jgi:hypothetical protein